MSRKYQQNKAAKRKTDIVSSQSSHQDQSDCVKCFWYIICCQWLSSGSQSQTQQTDTSLNVLQLGPTIIQIPKIIEQLSREDYQNKKDVILQLQKKKFEELKVQGIKLFYEISKYYLFNQDYSQVLKCLNLMLIDENRLKDQKFSAIQLKIIGFICKCRISIQDQHHLDTQFNNLKKQYLSLVFLIRKQEKVVSVRCQKILFISSLIYYMYLLREQSKPKWQRLKIDQSNRIFVENIKGIVENYALRLNVKIQKDRLAAVSQIYCLKQINQESSTYKTKAQQFDAVFHKNNDQYYFNLQNMQFKYSQKQIIPFISNKKTQKQQSSTSFIFQKEKYQQNKRQKSNSKSPLKKVGHWQNNLCSFWNLNAVYLTLQSNQVSWLRVFKKKQKFSFSQHIDQQPYKGMGILLQFGQHKPSKMIKVSIEQKIQKLFCNFALQNNKSYNESETIIPRAQGITQKKAKYNQEKFSSQKKRELDIQWHRQQNVRDQTLNVGLVNIGNTCYMSSALQCLHKSRHLTQLFQKQSEIIQKMFSKSRKFQLTELFKKFITQLWKAKQPFNPWQIKEVMGEKNYQFKHFNQSDATEFVLTFLLIISQELNDPTELQEKQIDQYNEPSQSIYKKIKFNEETYCKSIVEDTFTGRYKVVYSSTNPRCKHTYTLFEKFNVHYVEIPPESRFPTLQQCLAYTKRTDHLKTEDRMTCDLCQATTFDTKNMEIFEVGQILVLSFKRFLNGRKNDADVKAPEFLEPWEVISEPQLQRYKGRKYKLYGAIIHYGGLRGGHYISVCYNYKIRKWMKYDDQTVSQTSQRFQQIDFSRAMTLFYELVTIDKKNLSNY